MTFYIQLIKVLCIYKKIIKTAQISAATLAD